MILNMLEPALMLVYRMARRIRLRDREVFVQNGGSRMRMFQCRGCSLHNVSSERKHNIRPLIAEEIAAQS